MPEILYTKEGYPYYQALPTEGTPIGDASVNEASIDNLLPIKTNKPKPTTYILEPDLMEAQSGNVHVPEDVGFDDAGFPYNKITGQPVQVIRRPNVLPIAPTPDGYTFAMPKMLDVIGNVMGNVGGLAGGKVASLPGEVVLGSGMVSKAVKENPITIYRGEYSGNKGGKFWSSDFEFAKQFTQSGQDKEVLKRTIKPSEIYKADHIYAGDPDAVDIALAEAKAKGFKAIELNEGQGQPNSILFLSDTRPQVANAIGHGLEKQQPFFLKYPLASPADRWTNTLGQNDHLLETMTPDDFLKKSRPLKIDKESRETIDNLKQHIKEGKPLDPLELQINGKEDGRHRAIAAKELGIKEVPVLNFRPKEPFYSTLERAVDNSKIGKADANQWLGYLKNQPGVKQEELSWVLGNLPDGQISREALGDIVKNNKVQLNEVVKGFDKNSRQEWTKKFEAEMERPPFGDDELYSFSKNPTKYHNYQLPGGPLSRDTEILTKTGWKRIDNVSIGEEIITRKDENGELEWQPILAIPNVYAEKLYHFYNQSIDMQVTANHKMVVRKRRRSNRGIFRITAEQLWKTSECVIPLTGNWTGEGSKILFGYDACDAAEFIGWYLSEGSYKHKNGVKNTIQISQCRNHNPDNCDRLEALFDRMGVAWKYYGNGYGIGSKSLNKEFLKLLHDQPNSEGKFIPNLFFNENKHVINSLLAGLILGDGHHSEEGYDDYGSFRQARKIFFSKSKLLADGVQILALLSGYRASVRKRPTGIYCVGINLKEWNSVDDSKYAIIDYHDFAYCVTVKNHCIYVRRNGVAAFTGNSDYQEMLLTLPDNKINTQGWKVERSKTYGGGIEVIVKDNNNLEKAHWIVSPDKSDTDLILDAVKNVNKDNQYKSSHWDEPNILAHVRYNDRNIPDVGKSLHLEEIQSDWHQAGRKRGYSGQVPQGYKVIENNGKFDLHMPDGSIKDGFRSKDAAISSVTKSNNLVPDAPFKKNWDELAFKRMLHKAAVEDYDAISWTPGEAQAARYDLSKQTDKLVISKNNDNTFNIEAKANGGRFVDIGQNIKSDKLQDYTGKEIADKINKHSFDQKEITKQDILHKAISLAHEKYNKRFSQLKSQQKQELMDEAKKKISNNLILEGLDLKIGGEGMKSFYDKMLVDRANNLAKKFGGKVESAEIPTVDKQTETALRINNSKIPSQPIHVLKLTPELKARAKQGFPLFSSTPVLNPVSFNPFEEKKPKYRLTPIQGNPFQ